MRLAGIEAGGTKFVVLVGDADGGVLRESRIATGAPGATLAEAAALVREAGPVDAVGIAAFGPVLLAAARTGVRPHPLDPEARVERHGARRDRGDGARRAGAR